MLSRVARLQNRRNNMCLPVTKSLPVNCPPTAISTTPTQISGLYSFAPGLQLFGVVNNLALYLAERMNLRLTWDGEEEIVPEPTLGVSKETNKCQSVQKQNDQ